MKKCLIVVDYQNDFVDGTLGFKDAKKLESIIIEKIEDTLKNSGEIIFTLDTHFDDYLNTHEGINLPVIHCIDNTYGHDVYGGVKKYLDKASKIFKKNTFGSLDLGNYLSENEYESIEIVGLVTNMCVISNAIIAKAAKEDTKIIVDSNAVMSFDAKLHNKSLDILKSMHIEVL